MERYREVNLPASRPRFPSPTFSILKEKSMNLFEMTRTLIDIESVTNNEKRVGSFLFELLQELCARTGGRVEQMVVDSELGRSNVLASWGQPVVTLSTHMDTVPPFVASREDDDSIWGRGACDAKGIIAAMIAAAEKLLAEGLRNFGLLFLVGEERDSAGALFASRHAPAGARFLVNGEPTENQLALGCKGALRFEIVARGRMAHSAYPELGESAIEKLLDVLGDLRRIPMDSDPLLGRSTMNIGTITGGRAPNVIADSARAEIMFRIVTGVDRLRAAVSQAMAGRAEAIEILCTPAVRLGNIEGLPTTVVSFATDIPSLGSAWGAPYLLGPGSIHVAHTENERVSKQQLTEAVDIYARMARQLLTTEARN
jgi:acetylornithine deacetylase